MNAVADTQFKDFVVADNLSELVSKMNGLTQKNLVNLETVTREVTARDRDLDNKYGKDLQVAAIRSARGYIGDRLIRTVKPHKLLDPAAGPLTATHGDAEWVVLLIPCALNAGSTMQNSPSARTQSSS